jgi:hypothetical protein
MHRNDFIPNHYLINNEVNLNCPPIPDPRFKADLGAQITIGDLHANGLKNLWTLIFHGFIKLKNDIQDYEMCARLYYTPIDGWSAESIVAIETIINNAECIPEARGALLRYIGDETGDRAPIDLITLLLFKKMDQEGAYDLALMSSLPEQDKNRAEKGKIYLSDDGKYVVRNPQGVVQEGQLDTRVIDVSNLAERLNEPKLKSSVLEITSKQGHTQEWIDFICLVSNHGMELIYCYEHDLDFNTINKEVGLSGAQRASITNMQILIDKGLINRAEIIAMIKSFHLPHLKLLDYSVRENNTITYYTHAPFGDNLLKELAMQLDVPHRANAFTLKAKISNCEQMKAKFDQLKDNKEIHTLYQKGSAFYNLVWNRDRKILKRNPDDYYVNGHDLPDEKDIRPNVAELDNDLGKENIWDAVGLYPILYSHEKKDDQDTNKKHFADRLENLKLNARNKHLIKEFREFLDKKRGNEIIEALCQPAFTYSEYRMQCLNYFLNDHFHDFLNLFAVKDGAWDRDLINKLLIVLNRDNKYILLDIMFSMSAINRLSKKTFAALVACALDHSENYLERFYQLLLISKHYGRDITNDEILFLLNLNDGQFLINCYQAIQAFHNHLLPITVEKKLFKLDSMQLHEAMFKHFFIKNTILLHVPWNMSDEDLAIQATKISDNHFDFKSLHRIFADLNSEQRLLISLYIYNGSADHFEIFIKLYANKYIRDTLFLSEDPSMNDLPTIVNNLAYIKTIDDKPFNINYALHLMSLKSDELYSLGDELYKFTNFIQRISGNTISNIKANVVISLGVFGLLRPLIKTLEQFFEDPKLSGNKTNINLFVENKMGHLLSMVNDLVNVQKLTSTSAQTHLISHFFLSNQFKSILMNLIPEISIITPHSYREYMRDIQDGRAKFTSRINGKINLLISEIDCALDKLGDQDAIKNDPSIVSQVKKSSLKLHKIRESLLRKLFDLTLYDPNYFESVQPFATQIDEAINEIEGGYVTASDVCSKFDIDCVGLIDSFDADDSHAISQTSALSLSPQFPNINYTWIGKPNPKVTGHDMCGPITMAKTNDKNPIYFWCLEQYQDYYHNKMGKFGINVCSIESLMQEALQHPNLHIAFAGKKLKYIYDSVLLKHQNINSIPIRDCVIIKDAFVFFMLFIKGGYAFDTNILPTKACTFPSYDKFYAPCLDDKTAENYKNLDCWALFSPQGAYNKTAELMLNNCFSLWLPTNKKYLKEKMKENTLEKGMSILPIATAYLNNEIGTWNAKIIPPYEAIVTVEELCISKTYSNTHYSTNNELNEIFLFVITKNITMFKALIAIHIDDKTLLNLNINEQAQKTIMEENNDGIWVYEGETLLHIAVRLELDDCISILEPTFDELNENLCAIYANDELLTIKEILYFLSKASENSHHSSSDSENENVSTAEEANTRTIATHHRTAFFPFPKNSSVNDDEIKDDELDIDPRIRHQ